MLPTLLPLLQINDYLPCQAKWWQGRPLRHGCLVPFLDPLVVGLQDADHHRRVQDGPAQGRQVEQEQHGPYSQELIWGHTEEDDG